MSDREQRVMSNKVAEAYKNQNMQDLLDYVKFCSYPKSNRKPWVIFKQVVGRVSKEERNIIRFEFCKKLILYSVKKLIVGGKKKSVKLGCTVSVEAAATLH